MSARLLAAVAGFAAASLLLVVPASARADTQSDAAAGALFHQGRADAARGDYEQACRRFTESLRLAPTAGTLINLADCEEHRERLADALEHFRHALESLAPSDDRVPFVRGRIAKLSPRVPRVRLRAREGPLSVSLDEVALGDAALGMPLPVNPGTRKLVVRAPGKADRAYSFTVGEGASLDLDIAPGAPLPPAAPKAPDPSSSLDASGSSRLLAWTAAGIGGAGFVTATVAGILALEAKSAVDSSCPQHLCTSQSSVDRASSGQTEATVSTIGLGVGVVGAGMATYFFLRDRGTSAPSAVVTPLIGPAVAGLSVGGTFR